MKENREKKFEQALSELAEIVDKLENESLGLEESIALYEKGVRLSRICTDKLAKAQEKIEKLTKDFPQEEE